MAALKIATVAALSLIAAQALAESGTGNSLVEGGAWEDLRVDIVGDVEIGSAESVLALEAPIRAHDAATVPILLRQIDDSIEIERATVVIDENPAPVAGEFEFSEAMHPLEFEMRVRVDRYSNVRVLADTPDGTLMTGRFVKASGGCSAPATRDPQVALSTMGQMRLRLFEGQGAGMSTPRREAQIMIRHPNYSGLQRDQITQLFVPAHFIDRLEVWQDDDLLFSMNGGISISENPVFRFKYDDDGSETLTVKATDTEGNSFERVLHKAET